MNLVLEQTQENHILQVSTLMCLFELKGYECEEQKNITTTVYKFKSDPHLHVDYSKEKNPNWKVIKTASPGVDWL